MSHITVRYQDADDYGVEVRITGAINTVLWATSLVEAKRRVEGILTAEGRLYEVHQHVDVTVRGRA